MKKLFLISLCVIFALSGTFAQNKHWSRQFKKPASSTEMLSSTGMSNAKGKPSVRQVKWHEGKLWFSGSWEADMNVYWNLWTWSPVDGWEAVVYHHTAQGGVGPMGKINDFLWLPDGRLVVAGEFIKVDNPGGIRYREVQALAVYEKDEPTANKWQPLGTFQYNGTVSPTGSIMKIAYDKQGNDLYIVGTFPGISGTPVNNQVHKYDLDTKSYQPLKGGVYKSSQPKSVNAIFIDESTKPSTIYIGGIFNWVGGDGNSPKHGGTSVLADGVASYQEGRDGGFGWRGYADLEPAGDFIEKSTCIRTIAIVDDELWIGGAFTDASNPKIKGIAKWDKQAKKWVDPTGKGGVGRDVFQMTQAENGKLYFAGAFGGRNGTNTFFNGFNDGTKAHLAMSYDPATKTWEQLGNGLYSITMPECRLTVHGNDVYYAGDFTHFDSEATENESYFVAHWNENVDFSNAPVITATKTLPSTLTVNLAGGTGTWKYSLNGGEAQTENKFTGLDYGNNKITVTNGTYTEDIYAEFKAPAPKEVAIGEDQNVHWSRQFTDPQHNGGTMGVNTGMRSGTGAPTRTTCLGWHEDVLYFSGSWEAFMGERWFMWTWDKTNGWKKLAWKKGSTEVGVSSPPEGFKWHNGKLYVYGAMENYSGLAVYDPASDNWAPFTGKYKGSDVKGLASSTGTGIIYDLEWDSDGNMYFVGNWAWDNNIFPNDLAAAVRVTPAGEYQPLGKMMHPYKPGKPKSVNAIFLDETKTPTDIYIGGTFKYINNKIHSENQAFNVAKWNYTKKDWESMGTDSDGNPGLPSYSFIGFEFNGGYPVIRDLSMDKNGVLYAAGSVAFFDENQNVKERNEHFGIVKFDTKENKWVGATNCGGVSRDIYQMSWLDDKTLLLSGSFNHANDFTYLGNVAKLDVTTGQLTGLGGGLRRKGLEQTIASQVVHAIKGNELYFFGFFDHAGINANSNLEAPNSSAFIAMWDGTKNFDPNVGLQTQRLITVAVPDKYSSKEVKVNFKAWGAAKNSTYEWYKFSDNKYTEETTGEEVSMTLRGKVGDEIYRYVAVRNADGVLGGKLKVTVHFIYKDEFTSEVPYIIYNEKTEELTASFEGNSYEWYKDGTKLSSNTQTISSKGSGSYKVIVISGDYKTKESAPYVIKGTNTAIVDNPADDKIVDGFTVYPNPVTDQCVIKFDCKTSDYYKISVISSLGQIISILSDKNLAAGANTFYWNATGVKKGIYFIKIENKKGNIVHRIVVK